MLKTRRFFATLGLISAICISTTPARSQVTLTRLGSLAGMLSGDNLNYSSLAYSVSGDGSVVTGVSPSADGPQAYRWTQATGMVGIGHLSPTDTSSLGNKVSRDGTVIVGESPWDITGGNAEAYRWTQATGMVGLGDLSGGNFQSVAYGVSNDGGVVVGHSYSGNGLSEAMRWTQATGMVGLGDLAGGGFESVAFDVSGDGNVAVGYGTSVNGVEAMRWTQATGMVGLGDLAGGSFESVAYAISGDGSVIVGRGQSANGQEAFRWTQATGMVGLGDLTGGLFNSAATSVSDDGNIVVGLDLSTNGGAFVWTANGGMQSLSALLAAAGVDLSEWTSLSEGIEISADGTTIVGNGVRPDGYREGFVARDPNRWGVGPVAAAAPEPGSIALLATGALPLIGMIIRRRKRA